MSKKTKKQKSAKKNAIDPQRVEPSELHADSRARESLEDPDEPPMTSPNKVMALLFGIPLAVLAAAIAFRMLNGM